MDFNQIQVLYDLAKDEAAAPQDRADAESYLKANEDSIVEACLDLPLNSNPKTPKFENYITVYARNCLDSPWIRDPKTGRTIQDPAAFPDESDRVGNCLMAVARHNNVVARAQTA
jgi:hypothetical protein